MERHIIWKYELNDYEDIIIDIPARSEILHLGVQNDSKMGITDSKEQKVCMWVKVKVNPYLKVVKRKFRIVGTGYPIEYKDDDKEALFLYVGTFQFTNGFIGHVFEVY